MNQTITLNPGDTLTVIGGAGTTTPPIDPPVDPVDPVHPHPRRTDAGQQAFPCRSRLCLAFPKGKAEMRAVHQVHSGFGRRSGVPKGGVSDCGWGLVSAVYEAVGLSKAASSFQTIHPSRWHVASVPGTSMVSPGKGLAICGTGIIIGCAILHS